MIVGQCNPLVQKKKTEPLKSIQVTALKIIGTIHQQSGAIQAKNKAVGGISWCTGSSLIKRLGLKLFCETLFFQ